MLHLPNLIADLALILGAAGAISLIFKRLKQPLVLGYIIAGFLVGPHFSLFPTIVEIDNIRIWADIGVVFLLFSLGLEFSFKKLIKIGGVSAVTAFIEVGATMLMGYLLGNLLGWSGMDSLFLGGILAIASTTIIIRAFDELGVKSQKFTGIVLGVLVVEDLVAVVLMVILSTVAISQTFSGGEMVSSLIKLVFFLTIWFLAGIFFIPTFLKKAKKLMNDETMLIVSLALCLVMVLLATEVGFSSALGAFIMGSILAETVHAEKIEHLVKPVKDLFGAVFFVSVGMLIDPQILVEYAAPIAAATLVLLIGKPTFVTLGALITGQPLKTSLQAGMSLSQIGEFSFIIATLGLSLKVTSGFLYPVAVAVSVITAFTTPYMIKLSSPVYSLLENLLPKRWKEGLEKYSAQTRTATAATDWRKILRTSILNIVIFSVVITTIILLSIRYLVVIFEGYSWGMTITATITLLVLAPFLWALSLRRTQHEAYARVWLQNKGPLIVLQLFRIALSVFFIGFLLDRLFSPATALTAGVLIITILLLLSKKIEAFYGRIELRFLNNLNERERNKPALAPWDTHLADFVIPAGYEGVGKSLQELSLRERFGVNIAKIERDVFIIVAPGRGEKLYPNDHISVIGTDEQLQDFKAAIEPKDGIINDFLAAKQQITLKQVLISNESELIGQTIRDSGIRELTKGLVVGVEREGLRSLNPESDFVFKEGDIVWMVGDARRLQVIINENS